METKNMIIIGVGVAVVASLSFLAYDKFKEKKHERKMTRTLTPFVKAVEELESSSMDGGCGCGA